ncbi:MAG: dienelactone hydrolase family protein [Candidatus Omnitrophica bacterium]|nr:dienelactone hydrolase family protein [Candidatus Omnitrophota bacterium]
MQPVASETVSFQSDGFAMKAFLAHPAQQAKPCAAIVVVHEWWGLNDHIRDVSRRFAGEGYVTLAPDLYSRMGNQVTTDAQEAGKLMESLSAQAALRDLNAATRFLKQQPFVDPLRMGILGFSMGGTLALTQTAHNSDLKVAVIFYGKVPPIETLNYLLCPILYHCGAKDGWVTQQEVERLRQGLAQYGKPGEVVTYPNAQHAFFNDTRPDVYGREEAKEAWQRSLNFLTTHLH